MVERIPDLPDNVLGFTAKGIVTASDYESVIIPAVEAMFSRVGKVRFLYHLGEEFSKLTGEAMWDDAKLGFKHMAGWERTAVVTDVEWIRAAMGIFGLAMPGRVRAFHNREFSEAREWISG
jgi:SpoIIAA-like